MIPAEHRLVVPDGFDEPRARAIAALVEERFGSLPVTALLVYLVEHADASLLPALGWQFDIPASSWDGLSPSERRAFIADAIARQRKRGTIWATLKGLEAAGLPPAYIDGAVELLADGGVLADGTFQAAGYPLGTYFCVLASEMMLSPLERARALRILRDWMPGTRHCAEILYVDTPDHFGSPGEYEGEHTVPAVVDAYLDATGTIITLECSRSLVDGDHSEYSGAWPIGWEFSGAPEGYVLEQMFVEGRQITLKSSDSLTGYSVSVSYQTMSEARSRRTGNAMRCLNVPIRPFEE